MWISFVVTFSHKAIELHRKARRVICGLFLSPFKMSLPVATLTRMGYFSNLKAKRADKAATKEYNRLHAIWQSPLQVI